jgi:hypothetical protein
LAAADLTSREAVVDAVKEFNLIDRDAFLDKHGFGPTRKYFLRYRRRLYDSKAITGVAYGIQFPDRPPLRSVSFTGGHRHP